MNNTWTIRNPKTKRNEVWKITGSVHTMRGVYLNLVRRGKVRTVKVR